MSENFLYVPILQTKRGEYSALSELTDSVKDRIKPMFVLTQEKHDERSTGLAKNIKSKWGRPIYIDLNKVKSFDIQSTNYIKYVFEDLENQGVDFTPVLHINIKNHEALQYIIKKKIDSCIRIECAAFDGNTLVDLLSLAEKLLLLSPKVDLLIDFGGDLKQTRQAHAHDIENMFFNINSFCGSIFSKIIIAGSSIPKDLPRTEYNPYGFEARIDWLGFYDFLNNHHNDIEHPIFSDYSTSHPEEADPMPFVNPNAKIRYTISDSYMFAVGYQVNTHADGFKQYFSMSDTVVKSPYFLGSSYSWGDKYLEDCSNQMVTCGNMETWVRVGHNHHITFATKQIASQYGISI